MKKKISLLLTFALILSVTFTLFSVGVSTAAATYADDEAAIAAGCFLRIGEEGSGSYFVSFADAGAACGDGQTIVMISDYTLEDGKNQKAINTTSGSITIDGNGHTYSGNRAGWVFATGGSGTNAGTIVVKNLVLENKGAGAVAQFDASSPVMLENVKIRHTAPDQEMPYGTVVANTDLTLGKGVEITNQNKVNLDKRGYGIGMYIMNSATVTICDGAKIDVAGSAWYSVSDTAKVIVNGGDISSSNNMFAVAFVNKGKLEINGGLFTCRQGYGWLHVESGDVTVNGGTFIPAEKNTEFNVAGLFVGSGSYPGGTLTINGGTFYYPKATASKPVIKANGSKDAKHKVVINGGDFVGTPYIYYGGDQEGSADKGKSITIENPAVYTGASVRTAQDSNGIRFRSNISKAAIDAANAAKKQDTEIVYGTLIAPYDSVVAAGGLFTGEAMEAAKKDFVDIVAKEGIVVKEDGSVDISAALVNLKPENIEREFVAVAYLSYQTENGTVTVYANYSVEDHVRSMREVAYKALADVKTASEGYYQTTVSEWYALEDNAWVKKTGTAYSAYSEAQLAVIRKYIVV